MQTLVEQEASMFKWVVERLYRQSETGLDCSLAKGRLDTQKRAQRNPAIAPGGSFEVRGSVSPVCARFWQPSKYTKNTNALFLSKGSASSERARANRRLGGRISQCRWESTDFPSAWEAKRSFGAMPLICRRPKTRHSGTALGRKQFSGLHRTPLPRYS